MSDTISFVQITDCHLFANKQAKHCGADVFNNLCLVLKAIKALTLKRHLKFVVFTGDLTQDHSEASYQNFVDAVISSAIDIPLYYLAGNHDDPQLLEKYLMGILKAKSGVIEYAHWQLHLLNSQTDTPSGLVKDNECKDMLKRCSQNKHQLLMMHHHPIDVDYFIDRHGLVNKTEFIDVLTQVPNLKAITCGHVHNALKLSIPVADKSIPLFTCPATSIQFDKLANTVANSGLPAGFREFSLFADGCVNSKVHFINLDSF